MAPQQNRSPLGSGKKIEIDKGTTIRAKTTAPVVVGTDYQVENDVLRRIKRFRNLGARFFPNATKALDHYLGKSGTFVEIPESKVLAVRKEAESEHNAKAVVTFKRVAILEAAAVWQQKNGFPISGGDLKPKNVEIKLEWQSGVAKPGLTDDNLTYYGSTIFTEASFEVRQVNTPSNPVDAEVELEISLVQWKSWVVDNYDWEGNKAFGGSIARLVGLPTQQEMNSLQRANLAKAYQRSSKSWESSNHGLTKWQDFAGSLTVLQDAGKERLKTKQARLKQQQKEREAGALPTPRPAEEMKMK